MTSPLDFERKREEMVSHQLERRGINDPRLLSVFLRTPRHLFVPADLQSYAYEDGPLPIGNGQTISQPYIVALMTDLLQLKGNESVLEIGTGSGYQAAILSGLCRVVHSVERHAVLADRAKMTLTDLGVDNVFIHTADGSTGWAEGAPYQGILVTAAAPAPPPPLLAQLDEGGRLVIPIGGHAYQQLEVWEKLGIEFHQENVLAVAFVPLRGAFGWQEMHWPDRE